MWWPEKKGIIALKERLRQEAEATVLLRKAIEAKDVSALEGALKARACLSPLFRCSPRAHASIYLARAHTLQTICDV